MKLYLFKEEELMQLIKMFSDWSLFTPQEQKEIFNAIIQNINPRIFEKEEAEWLFETIEGRKEIS